MVDLDNEVGSNISFDLRKGSFCIASMTNMFAVNGGFGKFGIDVTVSSLLFDWNIFVILGAKFDFWTYIENS